MTVERNIVRPGEDISRRELLRRASALGVGVVGVGGLSGALAACGSTSSSTGTAAKTAAKLRQGGTLKASIRLEADMLDPARSSSQTAFEIFTNMFDSLLRVDTKGDFVPGLATKWDTSDPNKLVLDLRENVTFHNGEPFTADDVKFTLERIKNPKTASPYAGSFDRVKKIEVLSPNQVALHLSQPDAALLAALVLHSQTMNKKAVESKDPRRNPVGTGPFQFVEWKSGASITMRKYAGYWEQGLPHLDKVVVRFMESTPARVQALQSGELDWIDDVQPVTLRTVKNDPSFNYVTTDTAGYPQCLTFNLNKKPLDNIHLRQAIAYAVDRKQIHEVVFLGSGEMGAVEVPSGSPWFTKGDIYGDTADLDKAKAAMEASGLGNVSLVFGAWTSADYVARLGEVLRDQLKPIGVDLKIERQDGSVWLQSVLDGSYQVTLIAPENCLDPDLFYGLYLYSKGNQNIVGYKNTTFDGYVVKARSEGDRATRLDLYAKARAEVQRDAPLYFVHHQAPNYLMRKNVGGSAARADLTLQFKDVGFTA